MMTTPFLWLSKRLAYMALAVVGAGLALFVYTRIGDTAITPGPDFGMYTYPPGDCQESDEDAEDPINVVFYDGAAADNLDYYFDEYHSWGDNGGEAQYFKTNDNCHEMDGQPSSNQIGQTRYHLRYSRGLDSSGEVDIDPYWLDYSVAAAHYEEWIVLDGCGFPGNHAVPPAGFNEGRENVVNNWTDEGGHWLAGLMNWDNEEERVQCNGWVAASNGQVAFIDVWVDSDGDGVSDVDEDKIYGTDPHNPDTDGDGCMEGQEVAGAPAPEPGSTGAYNPLAWYDFFDVPVPANSDPTPNGVRNQAVNLQDVLAVLFYVGTYDGGPPTGNGVDYDSLKDGDWNGDTVVDEGDEAGLRYDRSASAEPNPPWGAGPPDGAVTISDVLVALAQVGLSCAD